jgi:hypothetical protein
MGFYRANRMRVSIAGLRATLRNVCLLASQFNETWGWHEGVGAASSSTRLYFFRAGLAVFFPGACWRTACYGGRTSRRIWQWWSAVPWALCARLYSSPP